MRPSKLSVIDNEGSNHLLDGLRAICKVATTLELEVAFVTAAGVKKLMPSLRKVAERGAVRILTGLYQAITEPAALRALLKVQRKTKGRVMVKLARERDFHRKLYLARTAKTLHAIVGSSNLTMGGLISGGEINLRVAMQVGSPAAKRLTKIFRGDWIKGFDLTSPRIRRYEENSQRPTRRLLAGATLKEILGGETEHSKGAIDADDGKHAPRCWCDGVEYGVSKEIESLIYEQTGWDKKGYSWSALLTDAYEDNDCIMLVDRTTKPGWVDLVRVRAQTEMSTTDHGRFFVAHTKIEGMKTKKLTKNLLVDLAQLGIKKPGRKRLKMSEHRWKGVVALFRR